MESVSKRRSTEKMQTVRVNASKKYDVCIGGGLLESLHNCIQRDLKHKTVMVVSDDSVFNIFGDKLVSALSGEGCRVLSFVFPHGEQSKNISTYSGLVNKMCISRMTRSDLIIALGGGVVGDLAGFAAATYQRGIEFIQIPTTLLAAVDSSVGGKTGVDLESGKNQIGAFYQPSQVLCDINMLKTLPEEEYKNGCAEVIKYAMIGSRELFESIRNTPVANNYEDVICKCVSMKKDFVEKDEHDLGLRMLLNFGHTVGHAVETCSHYTISHGKGVAIGMAVITKAAVKFGYCGERAYTELISLLKGYGLPTETSFSAEELAAVMMTDKKSSGDDITLIVPEKVGKCVAMKVHKNEMMNWLKAGGIR